MLKCHKCDSIILVGELRGTCEGCGKPQCIRCLKLEDEDEYMDKI